MANKIGSKSTTGMKATISVAMSNYIEAGSIVAGAGGLSLWVKYLNLDDIKIGLLGAVSANAFGAIIGGFLLISMVVNSFIGMICLSIC